MSECNTVRIEIPHKECLFIEKKYLQVKKDVEFVEDFIKSFVIVKNKFLGITSFDKEKAEKYLPSYKEGYIKFYAYLDLQMITTHKYDLLKELYDLTRIQNVVYMNSEMAVFYSENIV